MLVRRDMYQLFSSNKGDALIFDMISSEEVLKPARHVCIIHVTLYGDMENKVCDDNLVLCMDI